MRATEAKPSFREFVLVWCRVALLSFGGPAGQIAVMHRLVVEEKRWVDDARFMHALNFCMLLPGPEAQQLATYLGWLKYGIRGGLIAGLLFILPGFLSILALSFLYAYLLDVSLVAALFFGLKAAVLALVLSAVVKLARKAVLTPLLGAIAVAAFIAIAVLSLPFPLVVLAAAIIGAVLSSRAPRYLGAGLIPQDTDQSAPVPLIRTLATLVLGVLVWMLPVMLILPTLGQHHVLAQESLFFAKMSMVTFGGAYSVLAYITQQAVEVHQWLLPGEMIDGLGMAESTPGPLIQVVQFVGFMAAFRGAEPFSPIVAATIGAVVTTWMTFVPSFVLIFAGAPWMERLRHIAVLAGALRGITAAVVGVIASLTLWFAVHVLFAAQQDVVLGMMQFTLPMISSLQWSVLVLLVAALVALLRFGWGVGRVLLVTVPAGAGWYLLAAPL